MRRITLTGAALALLLAMAVPAWAQGTWLITSTSGDPTVAGTADGSTTPSTASLPYALDNAAAGDTITFQGDLTVTDWTVAVTVVVPNVTVDGSGHTVTIDNTGATADHASPLIDVGVRDDTGVNPGVADNFTITGIDFVGMGGPSGVLNFTDVVDCSVTNCSFTQPILRSGNVNNKMTWIRLWGRNETTGVTNFLFDNNTVDGTPGTGSIVNNCRVIESTGSGGPTTPGVRNTGVTISNCELYNVGSVFYERRTNGVVDNYAQAWIAAGLFATNNLTIEDCYITSNGITQYALVDIVDAASGVTIQGCTFGEEMGGGSPPNPQGAAVSLWGGLRDVTIGGTGADANTFVDMASAISLVEFAPTSDDADLNHNWQLRGNTISGTYSLGAADAYDNTMAIAQYTGPCSSPFADGAMRVCADANAWIDDPWGADAAGTIEYDPAAHASPAPPDIASAVDVAGTFTVTGTGVANGVVDVFVSDPAFAGVAAGDGLFTDYDEDAGAGGWVDVDVPAHEIQPQQQVLLGTTTADGSGDWTWSTTNDMSAYDGWWVTAIQTDPAAGANTSALTLDAPKVGTATDSDGDGLLDDWEEFWGLDPNDASGDNGAAGDPDSDGYTNLEEQANGFSDPLNGLSTPVNPGPNGEPLPAAGAAGLLLLGGALAMAARRFLR